MAIRYVDIEPADGKAPKSPRPVAAPRPAPSVDEQPDAAPPPAKPKGARKRK